MSQNAIIAIIVVAVVIVVLAVAWYMGKKEQVKKIVRALVIEAEHNYATGTGDIKYEVVVGQIEKLLPPPLGLIFTPRFIDGLIKDAVEYIKTKTLPDGKTIEQTLTPEKIE